MTTAPPAPTDVLEKVDALGPPGTPVTTPEVADGFDCTKRTIYNRLDSLVDDGVLETKKVGANSRVWWRPASTDDPAEHDPEATVTQSTFRQLFENVPGLYLVVEPEDYEIVAVSDAYLEATTTDRAEIMGENIFDAFPADPDDPDPEGAPRLRRSLERVKAEQETDVMPVTFYPIPRSDSESDEFEERWWTPTNAPVVDDSGDVDYIIHRVEDVTPIVRQFQNDGNEAVLDRLDTPDSHLTTDVVLRGQELHEAKEAVYERLRENEERLNAFVTATSEVVYRMSPDWSEMYFLDGKDFVVDTENPRETWLEEYIPPDEEERVMAAIEEAIETKSTFELEHQVVQADGTRGWVHARAVPVLDDDGEIVEWFGTSTDITERKRAERARKEGEASLERLNAASQELIDAEAETIADCVPPLVREVLDVEYAALWRYDDQRGDLDEYAVDVVPDVDVEAVEFPSGVADQVWETFVGTDVDVTDDLDVSTDVTSPLRSLAFAPLGRHGVVCLGSTGADTFDRRTVDLVETVASTVETAWDRADSEEALARRNEELTRLDRLNSLIRSLDQALVGADTRGAIEEAVCEQLANSELYESAWLATYDAETDSLRPQAWAGVDSRYLEDRTAAVGDASSDDPLCAAHRTGEMQVVSDVAVDARAAPWREAALEYGGRSCIVIPIVYEESTYGTLTVYGRTPQPDERETDVLGEFGETIAHAIHALEASTARRTDSAVELTVRTRTAESPLVRLARELDCVIEFDGLVPGNDGDATVFFTPIDASPEDLVAESEQLLAIEDPSHVADRETGALFKARLAETTLPGRFLELDATIRSLYIDAGAVTAVVELPESADVREFTERLKRDLPDLELLSRRTRTREPEATLQSTVLDRLTPRQQEVLQLAYRSGYFELPRVQSGKELADVLGIVPSTFTKHIRNAERTVLDVVFVDEQESRMVG